MRKLKTAALLLAVCLSACVSTTPREAADYNNLLMKHQKAIIIQYDSLLESFDTYVAKKMEHASLALMQEIDNATYHIQNMEAVEGGEDFKLAMLSYIDTYKDISQNTIPWLISIYSLPQNEFSPDLKAKWDVVYKEMDTKLKNADKALKEAQARYAGDFKLKISL